MTDVVITGKLSHKIADDPAVGVLVGLFWHNGKTWVVVDKYTTDMDGGFELSAPEDKLPVILGQYHGTTATALQGKSMNTVDEKYRYHKSTDIKVPLYA